MVSEGKTAQVPASIEEARKKRAPWTATASALRSSIGTDLGTEERAKLFKAAAKISGYTAGALRRFVATLDFLERFPEQARPDPDTTKDSFTAIEMIQRISRHDAAMGQKLMAELRDEKIAISKLRLILKDSKIQRLAKASVVQAPPAPKFASSNDERYSAAVARNWRADAAMEDIRRMLLSLSGYVEYFGRPAGTPPMGVRADAIAWLDEGWTKGDGFEVVHAPAPTAKAVVSDRVSRAVVASRFFRRHYIVFTPDSRIDHVHRTVGSLNQLDATSVGVVWLEAEKPLLRKPSGRPIPDRSKQLSLVCPLGKWDENFRLNPKKTK
jgi:hypothetical protein